MTMNMKTTTNTNRNTLLLILSALLISAVAGFSITPPAASAASTVTAATTSQNSRPTSSLFLSSADDDTDNSNAPRRSSLEGNTRPPTKQELALMDEMIDKLADAKAYDLPNAVKRAFRVISSPQFFMRIADRADTATGVQKEKLVALAANLVSTLEAVVSTTEDRLDERAKDVESVIKAAAEPDSGEFMVPLLPARVDAMRSTLQALDHSSLDEGFLSTVDAWMMKSQQDGMDLMVGILQKALQLYAGTVILRSRPTATATDDTSSSSLSAAQMLERLLGSDAESWDAEIQQGIKEDVTALALQNEVQRTMETIVLSLEAGSMAQRVQAEYLQEMVKRVEQYIK